MQVKFKGKIYIYGAITDEKGLKYLCRDIFKEYLKKYPNKNFSELRNFFKNIHKLKEKIILNEEEFKKLTIKDPYKRYFEIEFNNKKYYFTSQQWGKINARNNLIEIAKKENFDIEILSN